MNLKHLRYFLAVAEEQSFVHAANKVHIEPSPLSRAIKELEARLGVRLLHRAKGSVQLTWPGKVLEEEARNIMAQVENAKNRVHSASRGFQSQLRIGLTDGLVPPRLAQLLALSRKEDPATEIRIHDMTLSDLTAPCGAVRSTRGSLWTPGEIPKESSGSRHGRNIPPSPCQSGIRCSLARKSLSTRHCIIR